MEEVKKQGTESLFVPYELALKLKELGFNQPCFGYYTGDKKHLQLRPNMGRINEPSDDVPTAPTFSQAFDWFRKEKGFDSWIVPIHYSEKGGEFKKYTYVIEPVIFDETFSIDDTESETYEESRLECLKKLIEIVKNLEH